MIQLDFIAHVKQEIKMLEEVEVVINYLVLTSYTQFSVPVSYCNLAGVCVTHETFRYVSACHFFS